MGPPPGEPPAGHLGRLCLRCPSGRGRPRQPPVAPDGGRQRGMDPGSVGQQLQLPLPRPPAAPAARLLGADARGLASSRRPVAAGQAAGRLGAPRHDLHPPDPGDRARRHPPRLGPPPALLGGGLRLQGRQPGRVRKARRARHPAGRRGGRLLFHPRLLPAGLDPRPRLRGRRPQLALQSRPPGRGAAGPGHLPEPALLALHGAWPGAPAQGRGSRQLAGRAPGRRGGGRAAEAGHARGADRTHGLRPGRHRRQPHGSPALPAGLRGRCALGRPPAARTAGSIAAERRPILWP